MRCPECQTDNRGSDAFCRQCGAKLEQICPRCGTGNAPLYAFCGNCGCRLIPESISIAEIHEPAPTVEVPEPVPPVEETPTSMVIPPEPVPTVGEPSISMVKPPEPMPTVEEPAPISTAKPPEVKARAPAYTRVTTGIEGLDHLIGGGFLAGKVYLVSGESGTGKTVFGLQYLYHGLLQGENGIYISGDEKASHLVVDAESLGWDIEGYIKEKRLQLLDVAPYFADIRAGKKKELDVRTVVKDLTGYAKAIGAKRLVIDPIAPLVFVPEHSAFVQEYVRDFIFAIEDSLGCTVVITADIISGSASLSRYGMEEFVSKGVIVLGMAMRDGKRVRTLSLRKMRSTPIDINDHVFEILPDQGIVIKD